MQIFVGGLDSSVTDEHLRHVFAPYGELVHVKIPVGKRCGFVQFSNRYINFLVLICSLIYDLQFFTCPIACMLYV